MITALFRGEDAALRRLTALSARTRLREVRGEARQARVHASVAADLAETRQAVRRSMKPARR
jgi:hypothetical protein